METFKIRWEKIRLWRYPIPHFLAIFKPFLNLLTLKENPKISHIIIISYFFSTICTFFFYFHESLLFVFNLILFLLLPTTSRTPRTLSPQISPYDAFSLTTFTLIPPRVSIYPPTLTSHFSSDS